MRCSCGCSSLELPDVFVEIDECIHDDEKTCYRQYQIVDRVRDMGGGKERLGTVEGEFPSEVDHDDTYEDFKDILRTVQGEEELLGKLPGKDGDVDVQVFFYSESHGNKGEPDDDNQGNLF